MNLQSLALGVAALAMTPLFGQSQLFVVMKYGQCINEGRWELLDAPARRYRFHHQQGGWVDTVTLSLDGQTLEGTDNHGSRLKGTRQ